MSTLDNGNMLNRESEDEQSSRTAPRGCRCKVTALLERASFNANVGRPLSKLGSSVNYGVPQSLNPTDFHRPMTLNLGITGNKCPLTSKVSLSRESFSQF